MDPVITISDEELVVEPGGEVSTRLKVRNTSDIVDQYDLTVLGEAAPYAQVIPPKVSVYVGDTVEATVVFRPPYDTTLSSGQIPFGVRAVSEEHHDRAEVAEGQLTVGSINMVDVTVSPVSASGRWRSKARVHLHNRGTEELTVRLGTVDPDEKLSFALAPREIDIPSNARREAFLKIRPRKPVVLGQPAHHRYQISYKRRAGLRDAYLGATTGGETEAFVDASFEQKPILAKWMMAVALLLVALIAVIAFRAQTADITVTPEKPIAAPNPPTDFRIEPGVDSLDIFWTPPDPLPAGYILSRADPALYATGVLSVSEVPDINPIDSTLANLTLPVEGGTTQCLFIQSVAEIDGNTTRSVIVGVASPRGLIDTTLPNANCEQANRADTCDAPVIETVDATEDPNVWTVRWTYGEGCDTADLAEWAVSVNGQPAFSGGDVPTDAQGRFFVNVTLDDEPVDDTFFIEVSPGEDQNDVTFPLPAQRVREVEAVAAQREDEGNEADEREGRKPTGSYAIVTSHRPSPTLPLTDGPLTLERFLDQIANVLTGDQAPPTFDVSRVYYGPAAASAERVGQMLLINIDPFDERDYYLIVDGFDSPEQAQTQVCDAVDELLEGLIEEDFASQFPVGDRPDPCRVF